MRTIRKGKEISFKTQNFTVKYGTLNQEQPNVIYLRAKTRILPSKDIDYAENVKSIRKTFQECVIKEIAQDNELDNKHIMQLSTNENGLKYNKTSILKFDIFIKPLYEISFIDYLPHVKKFSDNLCLQMCNILEKNDIGIKQTSSK